MCVCVSLQCAEQQKHVSESLYPFTYNPKMSLTLSQAPDSTQRSPPGAPLSLGRLLPEASDCRVRLTHTD